MKVILLAFVTGISILFGLLLTKRVDTLKQEPYLILRKPKDNVLHNEPYDLIAVNNEGKAITLKNPVKQLESFNFFQTFDMSIPGIINGRDSETEKVQLPNIKYERGEKISFHKNSNKIMFTAYQFSLLKLIIYDRNNEKSQKLTLSKHRCSKPIDWNEDQNEIYLETEIHDSVASVERTKEFCVTDLKTNEITSLINIPYANYLDYITDDWVYDEKSYRLLRSMRTYKKYGALKTITLLVDFLSRSITIVANNPIRLVSNSYRDGKVLFHNPEKKEFYVYDIRRDFMAKQPITYSKIANRSNEISIGAIAFSYKYLGVQNKSNPQRPCYWLNTFSNNMGKQYCTDGQSFAIGIAEPKLGDNN